MKRVYVAGPYSADNVLTVLQNIGRGQRMARELWELGFATFCPWFDKEFVIGNPDAKFTVQQFYDYSMAWLEVSDAVFLLPNWQTSKGTLAEFNRAHDLGIPIFETIAGLKRWADNG